jgi:hypothetical protein
MGGHYSAPPPPDYSPMIAQIELMRQQQAQTAQDAAEAQRRAMIDAQNNAAQAGMSQSNAQAQQNLMRAQEYQKAQDAAASQSAAAQAGMAGSAITGGPVDLNAMNSAKLANLGAAAPYLPKTMANLAGSNLQPTNPAQPQQKSQFQLPNTMGVTFGGA